MSDNNKTTTIGYVNSTGNDVGIHIGPHHGDLHLAGGTFRHGKVGVMIGGNPADVVGSSSKGESSVVNVFGDVNAPLNVATGNTASISSLTLDEINLLINSSEAPDEHKLEAKSKLQEFMTHPLVIAIVGGLASGSTGLFGK